MTETSRRSALRLIGTVPLAIGFGVRAADAEAAASFAAEAVRATAKGVPYKPKFFSPREWETVRVLVDLVIPRDERSGSATEAGVPEFMDFLMMDPEEEVRTREWRQTAMRGGLAWIDRESRRRSGKSFVEASAAERTALLDDIAFTKPGEDDEDDYDPRDQRLRVRHGPSFFNSFRDLTAAGFWSSKIGVADIGYIGNTFVAKWEGPPLEVRRKIGVEP